MTKVSGRFSTKLGRKQHVPESHKEFRAKIKREFMKPEVVIPDGRKSKVEHDTSTFAGRIRDAREERELTQANVAEHMGVSRAAIAQWERGMTLPQPHTIMELARFLRVTPQWLAFGITDEPQVIEREVETPNFTRIREVLFEGPESIKETGLWGAPTDWLTNEMRVHNKDTVVVLTNESENMAPRIEPGDRLLIDIGSKKPSPPGVFAHWDGYGVVLNHITIIPGPSPKAVLSSADGRTKAYEVPAEELTILGRVKGVWQSV